MRNVHSKLVIVALGATIAMMIIIGNLYSKGKDVLDEYKAHVAAEQLFFPEGHYEEKEEDDDFPLADCTDENQAESEFTWEGDLENEYNIPSTGDTAYYGLTEDELNLLYAVVMQEGGPTYESAEAVTSTIINRVNNPAKWGWAGDTIIEQITYPQQYCYSLDDYWVKYLNGNVPDTVKWGVLSVLEYGPVHDYDCFRGYYIEGCEQISDNWYFVG